MLHKKKTKFSGEGKKLQRIQNVNNLNMKQTQKNMTRVGFHGFKF